MAQKVQVVLIDDIDGSTATETINFSLEGSNYEIDLSARHAAELREALAPWVAAGRKVSSRSAGKSRAASGGDVAKIRAWAKANGHAVSERGRIPASIRDAYHAAH